MDSKRGTSSCEDAANCLRTPRLELLCPGRSRVPLQVTGDGDPELIVCRMKKVTLIKKWKTIVHTLNVNFDRVNHSLYYFPG
jgi:hypothetical protein